MAHASTAATASSSGWVPSAPLAPRLLPTLTILAHPDPRRIGERAELGELASKRPSRVSRTEPSFGSKPGGPSRALEDRFLSRKAIQIRGTADGSLLFEQGDSSTSVIVDGVRLIDRLEVPSTQLDKGMAVVLADRVALWLNRTQARRAGSEPEETYGLVGVSDALRELRHSISKVAEVDIPVLILGPTGSGKELVARALHEHGPRSDGPFVAVSLGALTPSLAAAQLFGAKKGAFTGAVRDQAGHFLRAHGGTLFLDEVGEAPPELQAMLLRALETREILAVGAERARPVSVRIVSATDAVLEERVRTGAFRAPLLHRLAGYQLDVPPLAARKEDVGLLLRHFLHQDLARLGRSGSPPGPSRQESQELTLDAGILARMASYDWPGNVRELRNMARQLAIDSRDRDRLVLSTQLDSRLPSWTAEERRAELGRQGQETSASETSRGPKRRRKPSEIPEEELLQSLRAHRFDLKATAAALRVSRTGLYSRLERSPSVRTASQLPEQEIRRAHAEHGGDLEAMVIELEVSERALRQRLKDLGLR